MKSEISNIRCIQGNESLESMTFDFLMIRFFHAFILTSGMENKLFEILNSFCVTDLPLMNATDRR
jgi:hypothetical protein